mmetsp:Transcript_26810/g.83440  ORF Transcript_26810/g.83440 Transcript_26810/m.83440 type:complete len:245 (+) Transcript_26810:631-1365(+)
MRRRAARKKQPTTPSAKPRKRPAMKRRRGDAPKRRRSARRLWKTPNGVGKPARRPRRNVRLRTPSACDFLPRSASGNVWRTSEERPRKPSVPAWLARPPHARKPRRRRAGSTPRTWPPRRTRADWPNRSLATTRTRGAAAGPCAGAARSWTRRRSDERRRNDDAATPRAKRVPMPTRRERKPRLGAAPKSSNGSGTRRRHALARRPSRERDVLKPRPGSARTRTRDGRRTRRTATSYGGDAPTL